MSILVSALDKHEPSGPTYLMATVSWHHRNGCDQPPRIASKLEEKGATKIQNR